MFLDFNIMSINKQPHMITSGQELELLAAGDACKAIF